MFDFVPLQYYTTIHYHILLFLILGILLWGWYNPGADNSRLHAFNVLGVLLVIFYTLYIGQRQVSFRFGDTINYNNIYQSLLQGKELLVIKDYFFNYMMIYCSKIMSFRSFMQWVDVLYIVPCVLFSVKYFKTYWFFGFLCFISSFSFWSYGTNGLRNGLGTSFFVMALYYYDKKWLMYLWFTLAYFMHASIVIPLAAFVVSGLYKDPKAYLIIWVTAIPISLFGGTSWNTFFANLGFAEDRTSGYLTGGEQYYDQFSKTGFRWDFVLYSASAVFAGWYYIFKKKITDLFYIHLFGMYCIANAFWILVITAAFSNRFAYLSWFLMPIVIVYPLVRYKLWDHQNKMIAYIILAYFAFTYFMNVIL